MMRAIWCARSECQRRAPVPPHRAAKGRARQARRWRAPQRVCHCRAAQRSDWRSLEKNIFAALVEQNQRRTGGKVLVQPVRFLALSLGSVLRTAFWGFDKAGKFQANGRPALRKTLEIAVGKLFLGAGLHAAHGKNRDLHRRPSARAARRGSALVDRLSVEFGSLPHLFDVVELAHFRTENMDDDIARVDQHPITAGKTFDSRLAVPGLFQSAQADRRPPLRDDANGPTR